MATEVHRVFTVDTLAEHWCCSPDVIYDLLRKRKLKAFKVGAAWRITARAVEDFENKDPEE